MLCAGGSEFNDKLGVQNIWLPEFTKKVEKVLKLATQEFNQVSLENMTNEFIFFFLPLFQWICTINNISKQIYLSENPEVTLRKFIVVSNMFIFIFL